MTDARVEVRRALCSCSSFMELDKALAKLWQGLQSKGNADGPTHCRYRFAVPVRGLGGGYYGYSHYGPGGGGGILVVVLIICVVLYLLRGSSAVGVRGVTDKTPWEHMKWAPK